MRASPRAPAHARCGRRRTVRDADWITPAHATRTVAPPRARVTPVRRPVRACAAMVAGRSLSATDECAGRGSPDACFARAEAGVHARAARARAGRPLRVSGLGRAGHSLTHACGTSAGQEARDRRESARDRSRGVPLERCARPPRRRRKRAGHGPRTRRGSGTAARRGPPGTAQARRCTRPPERRAAIEDGGSDEQAKGVGRRADSERVEAGSAARRLGGPASGAPGSGG